ncbi:hypothetical protein HN51_058535 [Arachis hypogaea]
MVDRLSSGCNGVGRHLFVGDPNLTDTPCVMFGRDLLGINHFIRGFDVLEPSLDVVVSEVHFRSVGLIDGVVSDCLTCCFGSCSFVMDNLLPFLYLLRRSHRLNVHTFFDLKVFRPLTFDLPVVLYSSGLYTARYISGITWIYGLLAVFRSTVDSSLRNMCLWPSADSSENGDPNPDFYRLLFLALDPVARRVAVSGPFYLAFRHELRDFMMFKDNHGNEFRVMLDKVGNNAFFSEGFRSMVTAYNIRHGAWLCAYYQGDGTLCISIRNLDGSRIIYLRTHSRSNCTGPTMSSMNPLRSGTLSRDVVRTGNVIPPFAIGYTPPPSPVRSNTFGSPQYPTNSLGCPVYFASTASQASPVHQVHISSPRRAHSLPVARANGHI